LLAYEFAQLASHMVMLLCWLVFQVSKCCVRTCSDLLE
jgi:hypothetical protein